MTFNRTFLTTAASVALAASLAVAGGTGAQAAADSVLGNFELSHFTVHPYRLDIKAGGIKPEFLQIFLKRLNDIGDLSLKRLRFLVNS